MQGDRQASISSVPSLPTARARRDTAATRDFTLAAGQSERLHVRAGAVLHVSDGHVELAGPPQWLAENLYWPGRRLAPGSVFVIVESGWVTLSACNAARLRVTSPAPAGFAVWLSLWHRFLAPLAQAATPKRRPARERL